MRIPTENEKRDLIELVKDLIAHGFKEALECTETTWGGYTHHVHEWESRNYSYLRAIDCKMYSGMTRVVIVPEIEDWVLKFNIHDPSFDRDFNMVEMQHFQSAIEAKLDEYFAAVYCLGAIDGVMAYIQERVRCDEDEVSESFYEYALNEYYPEDGDEEDEEKRSEDAWDQSYQLEDEERIYAMVWNSQDAYDLVDFCNHHNINDIHSSNWGYRDGNAVLVDYAGY